MPEAIPDLGEKIEKFSKDFERDGYAVFENFLSPEEVEDIRAESLRLIKEESSKERRKQIFGDEYNAKNEYFLRSGDKIRYFFEPKAFNMETNELVMPEEQSVAKIAHAIHGHNPVFKKHTFSQKVKDIFKALGYGDPVVLQSMVIFKNPHVGGEYLPHQDAAYLTTDPVHVAGLWFALDDATAENGCLEFIPGSHKGKLERRFVRTGKKGDNELLLEWTAPNPEYKDSDFKPAAVKRGSMVALDGLVVHRSAPNNSDKPRWIYTFHVMDKSRAVYMKDNWLQPEEYDTLLSIYEQ